MTRWSFGLVLLLTTLAGAQPMPAIDDDIPTRPEELEWFHPAQER